MILRGVKEYSFDITDESTGETSQIKLFFRYMTPRDEGKLFVQGVDVNKVEYEAIGRTLFNLLTPNSKKKIADLPFQDFDEETGEIKSMDIPNYDKLLMLMPRGLWEGLEIIMTLQVGGTEEKAKAMVKAAMEQSQREQDEKIKKNLIQTSSS